MKNIPLVAGILFLVVGGFVAWYCYSFSHYSYTDLKDNNLQFSFSVPSSWAIVETGDEVIAVSPRYRSAGDKGASIAVTYSMGNYPSTPQAYVAYDMDRYKNCTNCTVLEQIIFGGQPAVLTEVRFEDSSVGTTIETVHMGRQFQISLSSHVSARVRKEFIDSFTFSI